MADAESPAEPVEPGPVEVATQTELDALTQAHSALGQCALALARAIDSGRSLMAAPAMVKELRATLKELTPDDGGDDFTRLMASLSAPVRHSSPTGTVDPRA